MWTHENRPKYNRDHLRYPSDLTDDEWAYVEPLIPPAKRDAARPQPTRQPEAVPTGLEGDSDAFDPVSCLPASSRHRCSNFSNALSSTASFFNGERSTPGTIPATSKLDWPISITAISVASCSRITGDLLKSFSCGMGRSVDSLERRWCHCPRRSPHSIFLRSFYCCRVFSLRSTTGSPKASI